MTPTNTEALSDERLAEMLAGLEGVTPGPWDVMRQNLSKSRFGHWSVPLQVGKQPGGGNTFASVYMGGPAATHNTEEEVSALAEHLARCDPDTIRYLVTQELSRRSASNTGGVEVKAVNDALAMLAELQQERPDGSVYEDVVREKAGFYANVIRNLLTAVNASLAAEAEPMAWQYELATRISHFTDEPPTYHDFDLRISFDQPNVPEGSIRNLRPLYTHPSSPVSAEVTVTDEMVERAARAMEPMAFREEFTATDEWYELEQEGRNQALGRARAALTAALDQHGKEG